MSLTVGNTYDIGGSGIGFLRADAWGEMFACAWPVFDAGPGTWHIRVSVNRQPVKTRGTATGWNTATLVSGLTKTNVGCFFLPQGWLAVTYDQTVAGVTSPVIQVNHTGGADMSAWEAPVAFPDSSRVDRIIRAQGTLYRLRQEVLTDTVTGITSYAGLLSRLEGITGEFWTTEYMVLPPGYSITGAIPSKWETHTRGITGFYDGATINVMYFSDRMGSINTAARLARSPDPHDWTAATNDQLRSDGPGSLFLYTGTPFGCTLTQSNILYVAGEQGNTADPEIGLNRGAFRLKETVSGTPGYWLHLGYKPSGGSPTIARGYCDVVSLENFVSGIYIGGSVDGPPYQLSSSDGGATWQHV